MEEVYKKYGDIIHQEYRKSFRKKPMPILDRAAQFSAFQALTGYDEAVRRTAYEACKKADKDEVLDITIC